MFDSGPRRAARIVFGLVLIGSTLWVSASALANSSRANDAPIMTAITTAWAVAFGAAVGVYLVLKILPLRLRVGLASSLVIPSAGIVLLLPITLHMIYFQWTHRTDSFADWVKDSVYFVGLAHAVGAFATAARANAVARGEPGMPAWWIYAITVAAANIPIPLIPSIIAAVTGVFLIPIIWALAPLARWERRSERLPAMVVL